MKRMWQQTCLFFLLSSFILLGCSMSPRVYHDTQGHTVSLAALKGKWVIVTYWAAWCPNCMHEIPELNRFYQHLHDNNVILYGVNYDQLAEAPLKKIIEKNHITFPILLEDPSQSLQFGDIAAIPATFILNPKGEVIKKILGPQSEKSLFAILRELQQHYAP